MRKIIFTAQNQIKSIGEHLIEINPYEGINEEFTVTIQKN